MFIQRNIAHEIKQLATKMPVISVNGPRQSGKTTLIRQIFAEYAYTNLENPVTRTFARQNPQEFLQQSDKGIIIDEAQYLPEIFSYILLHVDETRRNGEIILSGSQNFLLMERITQSLAGRVAIFHLLPFSTDELKGTDYEQSEPFEYIFKGFFPRVYDQNVPVHIFYLSYIQSYIERDVRQVQAIGDLDAFERFLRLCAGRIGQLFNQSSLATEVGVSVPTINRWMSVLQTGFVAFKLSPYFKNFNKRILKTPKLYFYDTGLACSLLGIQTVDDLQNHFARGALFENFIIVELMKQFYNRGIRPNLYFWRDHTGHEIDLLLDWGAKLFPFEIKSAQTLNTSFFSNLEFFQQLSATPAEQSYLIYNGSESFFSGSAHVRRWDKLPVFE